ncbi:MAG: hypothetical protein JWN48_1193, partial [Myxococcaceae bacterium]|nr:hypothetical protein [Myxococcaceae bacterium]
MLLSSMQKAVAVAALAIGLTTYAPASQAQAGAGIIAATRSISDSASGWTYLEIAGAMCRDKSPASIIVRYGADRSRAMITMQGGGLCYSGVTCGLNAKGYGEQGFSNALAPGGALTQGIYDPSRSDNALKDYTHIFVPYCTGDFFAGSATDVEVAGETNQFVGATNMQIFSTYIAQSIFTKLPELREVKLAGYSAGGFGALLNAQRVKRIVPTNAAFSVLLDSSPPFKTETSVPTRSGWDVLGFMRAPLFRSCVQQRVANLWNLQPLFNEYCASGCTTGNWVNPMFQSLLTSLPEVPVAFLSNGDDPVVEALSGLLGDPLCNNVTVPGAPALAQGLADLKNQMSTLRAGRNNWATYYKLSGWNHCFINRSSEYFGTVVNYIPLQSWVQEQFTSSRGPAVYR